MDDDRLEAVVAQLTRETWLRKQRGEVDALSEVVQDTKEQLWQLQLSMDDYSLHRDLAGSSPSDPKAAGPSPRGDRPPSPPAASPFRVGVKADVAASGAQAAFGQHNPFASPSPPQAVAISPRRSPPRYTEAAAGTSSTSDDARLIDFLLREKAQLEEDLAEREIILSALEAKWQTLATAVQEISADSQAKDAVIAGLRAQLQELQSRDGTGKAAPEESPDEKQGRLEGTTTADEGDATADDSRPQVPNTESVPTEDATGLSIIDLPPISVTSIVGKRARLEGNGEDPQRSTRPCTPPKRGDGAVADLWSHNPFTAASASPAPAADSAPTVLPAEARGGEGGSGAAEPSTRGEGRPPTVREAGFGSVSGRPARAQSQEMLARLDEKLQALSGPAGEKQSGSAWAELDAWSSRMAERKASLGKSAGEKKEQR